MAKAVRADLGKPVEPWIRWFVRGKDLKDPKKLLTAGTSKTMRMVRLTSPNEIQPAAIKAFVKQATQLDAL
jgi:hypothetical protein